MNAQRVTGIVLILGTVVYCGALAYLFFRAEFGTMLQQEETPPHGLPIYSRYPTAYLRGMYTATGGVLVAAAGYVLLADLLGQAGSGALGQLASVLFLIAAVMFVLFGVSIHLFLWAGAEVARTGTVPEFYRPLREATEGVLGVYEVVGLLATAGFGWAILRAGIAPAWAGWTSLAWGLFFAAVFFARAGTIPVLPMVMPLVIGVSLLLNG